MVHTPHSILGIKWAAELFHSLAAIKELPLLTLFTCVYFRYGDANCPFPVSLIEQFNYAEGGLTLFSNGKVSVRLRPRRSFALL